MAWKRDATVPHPSVWIQSFKGKRPLPDGRVPEFRIQDAPEEMFEEVIHHMMTYFLKDEPICENSELHKDPVSSQELEHFWRESLKHRMALVALDVLPDGTTTLAGVNMTCVDSKKDEKEHKFKGAAIQKVLGSLEHMGKLVDVYAKYGVTEYLTALGLSVAPVYRGQGLGLEILKARVPLCKAVGLKLTSTMFTADNSQELARRANFQLVCEMVWAEYKVNGQVVFPGLKAKMCKVMALRIE